MTSCEVIASRIGMFSGTEVLLILFTRVMIVVLLVFMNLRVHIILKLRGGIEGSVRLHLECIFVYLSLDFVHSGNTEVKGANPDRLRVITIIEVDAIEGLEHWWLWGAMFAKLWWLSLQLLGISLCVGSRSNRGGQRHIISQGDYKLSNGIIIC